MSDPNQTNVRRYAGKAIISCAITGGIHTPTMSPYLPCTPDRIAAEAIAAAQAGASILHLHARNPDTGAPASDPNLFMQFLPEIGKASDAVVNITTGGGLGMSLDARLAAPLAARPEMCSINMGSINFGLFPMVQKHTSWKHDWEKPYLENTRDFVFKNTFADIEQILLRLGSEHGVRFEFECYDVGHLYNLAHFLDRGLVEPPMLVQCIFGILGGIGADGDNLVFMKQTADKLFGSDAYLLSVLAAGKMQARLLTHSLTIGGNVRVGLEYNLFLGPGELAKSNADQVRKIRGIMEGLNLEVATPSDVRRLLQLKGKENVGF